MTYGGQESYEVFKEQAEALGFPQPTFDELPPYLKTVWNNVAKAAKKRVDKSKRVE